MLKVYVDGACSGNGKSKNSGGWGLCIMDSNDNIIKTFSAYTEDTTNNREELKAISAALALVKDNPATIYSDSAYSLNTINTWMYSWASKGWVKSDKKAPENLDLIKPIYDYMAFRSNIKFEKVKGHSGILGNEIADALASNNRAKLSRLLTKEI